MARSPLIVRPAAPDDADAIAAIYGPYVADTPITFECDVPDASEIARRIERITSRYPWLVSEREGRTIGYAYATRYRDRPAYDWVCESAIYVDKTLSRSGAGRALYDALFDDLSDRGFVTAVASITVPNRQSIAFHQALGFEERGVQTGIGYKLGRWHDVAFLQLDLAPRPARPKVPW